LNYLGPLVGLRRSFVRQIRTALSASFGDWRELPSGQRAGSETVAASIAEQPKRTGRQQQVNNAVVDLAVPIRY